MATPFTYVLVAVAVLLLAVPDVFAQGRGGGDQGRGGQGRGGGERGGGERGGGERGWGGGERGGGGIEAMLQRMDRNNNGILEPEEMQGPARGFLERLARDNRDINLNRPIPLDRLRQAIERAREQRGQGGEPAGGRGPTASVEPLVPGFGLDEDPLPAPGFGAEADFFHVRVTDDDLQEAEDAFRRYDRNRDGFLTRDELQRGRWPDDPMQYDRNGDGRLSLNELAVYFARQRMAEQEEGPSDRGDRNRVARGGGPDPRMQARDSDARPGQGSGPRPGGRDAGERAWGGGGSEDGGEERLQRTIDFLFQRFDTNGNGVLDRDEWDQFRGGDLSEADTNGDGRVTREELTEWMRSRMGGAGGGGPRGQAGGGGPRGEAGGDRQFFTRREGGRGDDQGRADGRRRTRGRGGEERSRSESDEQPRRSYRFTTATDRLPSGFPEWFTRLDANQDGQISMHEFASQWNDEVAADFARLDLNGDGIITADEVLMAREMGIERTTSSSLVQSSSSPRGTPSRRSTFTSRTNDRDSSARSSRPPNDQSAARDASDRSAGPDSDSDIDAQTLEFFRQVIAQYDTNGDGVLTEDEWRHMDRDPSAADTNGDGRITVEEYARWRLSQ